jgi:hypothetical protein
MPRSFRPRSRRLSGRPKSRRLSGHPKSRRRVRRNPRFRSAEPQLAELKTAVINATNKRSMETAVQTLDQFLKTEPPVQSSQRVEEWKPIFSDDSLESLVETLVELYTPNVSQYAIFRNHTYKDRVNAEEEKIPVLSAIAKHRKTSSIRIYGVDIQSLLAAIWRYRDVLAQFQGRLMLKSFEDTDSSLWKEEVTASLLRNRIPRTIGDVNESEGGGRVAWVTLQ